MIVGNWTIGFGKHKGLSYHDLVVEHPDYCCWLLANDVLRNKKVKSYLAKRCAPSHPLAGEEEPLTGKALEDVVRHNS